MIASTALPYSAPLSFLQREQPTTSPMASHPPTVPSLNESQTPVYKPFVLTGDASNYYLKDSANPRQSHSLYLLDTKKGVYKQSATLVVSDGNGGWQRDVGLKGGKEDPRVTQQATLRRALQQNLVQARSTAAQTASAVNAEGAANGGYVSNATLTANAEAQNAVRLLEAALRNLGLGGGR
ncbi:hypothetical protein [Pseudomonas sp. QC2]|uniref:hypothetical protein n=1 Tax=Pseudomonas sp. QC2 TaxID=2065822 RepID=UPI0011AF87B7|nr:hypothetical protein [Pseudomonas sp. QC2]